MTIVLSILSLPGFPIGTLFGAYCLWVLFHAQTLPLFKPAPPVQPASPLSQL
jgi:hypothetical protein